MWSWKDVKNIVQNRLVHIVFLPGVSRLVRGDTEEERGVGGWGGGGVEDRIELSLIHISEPTRPP